MSDSCLGFTQEKGHIFLQRYDFWARGGQVSLMAPPISVPSVIAKAFLSLPCANTQSHHV